MKYLVGLLLGAVAVAVGAGEPPVNVDGKLHPELRAAQEQVLQAFNKVSVAQKRNKDDMQGHAEKAKQLLDQASQEIKAAAEAATHAEKK